MKKGLFLTFLVSIVLAGSAQQSHSLHVTVSSTQNVAIQTKAYLFGYLVNRKKIIDTIAAGSEFAFKINDTLPKGFYNVMLYTDLKDTNGKYQRLSFDVINAGEDIDLKVSMNPGPNQPRIVAKTGENFIYNDYFRQKQLFESKISAIETAVQQYPVGDNFHEQLIKQQQQLKKQQQQFLTAYAQPKPNSLAGKYIQLLQQGTKVRIENEDITDPLLKHTPFIPSLVWEYMSRGLDVVNANEKPKGIIKRLEALMPLLKKDQQVYLFMLDELVKSYEKTGMNEIVVYLNEKYVLSDFGKNMAVANTVKEKNEVLKSILIGQQAPDVMVSNEGALQRLYDIKAKYTMLLFWESDCDHCQKLTDELIEYYHQNKSKDFEVIALALDTSQKGWLSYIVTHNFDWINYCDLEGWKSKAVKDYNIVATPSMFLLDSNKRIIAKPTSINELKALNL